MKPVALFILCAIALHAAPPLLVEWEMIPNALAGRRAIVRLDSGARIQGEWLGSAPDSFTINIQSASGRDKPPLGVQTLPRSAVRELRLRNRRIRGRVVGGILGYYTGAIIAFRVSAAAAFPVMAGVFTVGFLAGRAIDHGSRPVVIRPPDHSHSIVPGGL